MFKFSKSEHIKKTGDRHLIQKGDEDYSQNGIRKCNFEFL